MNLPTPTNMPSLNTLEQLGDRAAAKADQALESTRGVANDTLDKLHNGVHDLRDKVPGTLSRAAEQIDDLAHRAAERARDTTALAREKVAAVGETAVSHVRDDPMKSLLIAAATGAAVAALIGYLTRHHGAPRT